MSFFRVPGGVSENSPAETTTAGEVTVSASGDSNEGGGGGGEEAKGAVGRKLSKVGLRKLKIW